MADPFKVVGDFFSTKEKIKAAKGAAAAQASAANEAAGVQKDQLEEIRKLLAPYIEAGQPGVIQPYMQAGSQALQGLQGLIGLRGSAEQQKAIQGVESSARFQELANQGEQGILQNASATGGLRGGNLQGALAQFRPALLNQLLESQYSKLAGLTQLGSGAAQNLFGAGQALTAGLASAEQQAGANIGNFITNRGQAQAGGILGAGRAWAGLYQDLGNMPSQEAERAAKIAALGA